MNDFKPDLSLLNNDSYTVKLGTTHYLSSSMTQHSGLHCYAWAASQPLLDQFGLMAMQDIIVSVIGACIGEVADSIEEMGDVPLTRISAMTDVGFNPGAGTGLPDMHAVTSVSYRGGDHPGLTIFIALVDNSEVDAYIGERVMVMNYIVDENNSQTH